MRRSILALLSVLALVLPTPSLAALVIDSFESGPVSMTITTNGVESTVQNPNPAHCIATQRATLLHWEGPLGSQMSATLAPLQSIDDSIVLTLNGPGGGDLILEYNGGPWDLTQVGSNNRISVGVDIAPDTETYFAILHVLVRDDEGDSDILDATVSVTGNYQFPFSAFDSGVNFQAVEEITLIVSPSLAQTFKVRNIAATNGAAFTLRYDVWQPLTLVACGPARGGPNALAWNWGIVPSNPQIVAGSQLLVTGVGGQNCTNVTFQASDSGGGAGQLGDMAHVTVDWAGSTFDNASFEMRYATDPGAPFVATLLGDPVVDFWDTGFVIRHEVHAGDVPNAPDGTATQELVVTPYPGQELYFDYVEAIPLPLEEGGYSLSFGVTGAEFDPALPLLEMYATGSYADDAGVTSIVPATQDESDRATLQCHPTVSRTVSALALDRPTSAPSSIDIFDVAGRRVRRLPLGGGETSVAWDGRATSGRVVSAGVYLARWSSATGETATARVVRLR
jgi:hypothetical protein